MAKAGGNSTSASDKLSERDWHAVAKTLPPGADQAYVRAELERIARDKLSSEELVKIFEECARQSDQLVRSSPVTDEERVRLGQEARWCREQVKLHERMIGEPPKFRRQCAILLLWQMQGGGDPSKYKSGEAARYLQAASWLVFGQELSPEGAKDVIKKFRDLNFSAANMSGTGAMLIDDTKIMILRDGKLIPLRRSSATAPTCAWASFFWLLPDRVCGH
jgi:hypothetical protein